LQMMMADAEPVNRQHSAPSVAHEKKPGS